MDSILDYETALDMLAWQVEMGADEAILDAPINRFELVDEKPKAAQVDAATPKKKSPPPVPKKPKIDPVAEAQRAVAGVSSLNGLREVMSNFTHCELRKGARNFVFQDGLPEARVMVIGEAPGREEDIAGKPFAGAVGVLLDRMFAAIGLDRGATTPEQGLYLTNVLPWRAPGNRAPERDEVDMMLPFLKAHIALANPDIIVAMGNVPCHALLGQAGITRIRGKWAEALGKPVMPMFHPSNLLRNPAAKREAWADLLQIKARLRETS